MIHLHHDLSKLKTWRDKSKIVFLIHFSHRFGCNWLMKLFERQFHTFLSSNNELANLSYDIDFVDRWHSLKINLKHYVFSSDMTKYPRPNRAIVSSSLLQIGIICSKPSHFDKDTYGKKKKSLHQCVSWWKKKSRQLSAETQSLQISNKTVCMISTKLRRQQQERLSAYMHQDNI